MEILLLGLGIGPVLFIIAGMWHFKHLKYMLQIWIQEYRKYGKVFTNESSVSYLDSVNRFDFDFSFTRPEKRYPEIKNSKFLVDKLKEYRATRNFVYIGLTLYFGAVLIAKNYFELF